MISGLDVLIDVAVQGLTSMYDQKSSLFCARKVRTGTEIKNEGLSYWETLNALLGLNEAHQYDLNIPFDIEAVTRHHIERAADLEDPKHLGAYLWLAARSMPETLVELYEKVVLTDALDRFNENREGRTIDLCFLLIGLSEIRLSDGEEPVYLDELAYMTRQLLFMCYSGFGFFRAMHHLKQSPKKRVKYGRFTDQAFAVYAFMRYAQAFEDRQSLQIALECANQLVQHQGELGQWWDLYDVEKGAVARKYPVYSMHQDALAPLALLGLGERTGHDFEDAVNYGVLWLNRNNEIDMPMVSPSLNLIWEGIHDAKRKPFMEEAFSGLTYRPGKEKARTLTAAFECRPSHLGWLLFALSGYVEAE